MMKKFVKVGVALLLGLLLGSCSKPKEQKMQEVRFYANCIETGSIPITEISGVSFSLDIPTWECGLE